jgi:hypothetical protein
MVRGGKAGEVLSSVKERSERSRRSSPASRRGSASSTAGLKEFRSRIQFSRWAGLFRYFNPIARGRDAQAAEAVKKMNQPKVCLIDPRGHNYYLWQCVTATALLIVAFITPFEVGFTFDSCSENGWTVIPVINRILDGIFLVDIFVQFITM